jgi:hypothetical protein
MALPQFGAVVSTAEMPRPGGLRHSVSDEIFTESLVVRRRRAFAQRDGEHTGQYRCDKRTRGVFHIGFE